MRALKVGDPMDRATDIGPLARADLVATLGDQVDRSVAQGARLLVGGAPLARRGFFYPPTVLTDVLPGMAVFDEETFGPVAAVTRAKDADDAIRLANTSRYGLAATVFTRDLDCARCLAARLEVGAVFINGLVKSDPRLPFGGVKSSGYGRELGRQGILEFVNVKSVWIR
jgi:acyl-CoA reductase-like NAD-dependent aldehyde dehydrogenase